MSLSDVFKLEPTIYLVLVTDELKCYQHDTSLPVAVEEQGIDHYWKEVFDLKVMMAKLSTDYWRK